ncbi:ABC transporter permease [Burkholderia pseudomultivorans]|uniref:ABC transmembrane type-1 domain-containing protein n=1 Tax=Burkholderia pseudomultivorans TaxID=1207504 RepID=A0A132F4W2_9BURK|nr:ABC transporter permease [Burkholderia pseudomultivorans]KWF70000.1 hypothetical protein WT57_11665 [Burkholderia pseudomultivorans]
MSQLRIRNALLRYGVPAVLLGWWWVASSRAGALYFPPLSDVLKRFVSIWSGDHFQTYLLPSLVELVIGLIVSIVVGIAIGTVLGISPRLRRDISPITEFGRSIPMAAVIPIPLLLLGPGIRMDLILVVFVTIFPILIATCDGVRAVDPVAIQTAKVYGLSRSQTLRQVMLPAAMPQMFSGIRVALSIGISAVIVVGMVGGSQGLGTFVLESNQSFAVLDTWAGLLMIGLVGVVVNGLFMLVHRKVLAWHRGWRGHATE